MELNKLFIYLDSPEQSQSASQKGAIIGFTVGGVLLIAGLLVMCSLYSISSSNIDVHIDVA